MTQVKGIAKQLLQTKTTGTAAQVAYNSPLTGGGTIISAVTVSNCTAGIEQFAILMGPAGVEPDCAMVPQRDIKAGRTDPVPEIVGQIIPPGAALWIENPKNGLLFTVSGRELDR